MRIAIIGAGGVGGYFGAQLAAGGADVTWVARGAHLAAMQERGLTVESAVGPQRLDPVQATDDPATVGPVDLVMIAVKLWSTDEAVETARPMVGTETAVVSFQNGVDAVDVLLRAFGPERVLGGVAHIAALIESPGVVRHNGTLARLTFGELDGSVSPRAEALLAACEAGGVEAVLSRNVRGAIWEKFVFLAALSGMTCLTRLPIGPIRDEPRTRALLRDVMEEVVAVGRARSVELPAEVVDRTMAFVDGLPPTMIASMLADLDRGNRLELDWLAGAVVRSGAEHGVATPVNRVVHGALAVYADGRPARP